MLIWSKHPFHISSESRSIKFNVLKMEECIIKAGVCELIKVLLFLFNINVEPCVRRDIEINQALI